MINNIVIVGRLTKDPKIYEKEGNKLATMCVAITRNYKDKDQNTICDYLYCKAVGKIANNIELYLNKGSLVGITGQTLAKCNHENMKKKGRCILYRNFLLKLLDLCLRETKMKLVNFMKYSL